MLILTIRTEKPEAEIGLYDDAGLQLAYKIWQAHRELSVTILQTIENLLNSNGYTWHDIQAVIFYKGPGSFTGLRIGASVANALAHGQSVPIVATNGDSWIHAGIKKLSKGQDDKLALPEYGAAPRTTKPRK